MSPAARAGALRSGGPTRVRVRVGARPLPEPGTVPRALRWVLYGFVLSLPFEYPERAIPVEVTTLTAGIFVLASVFHPRVALARVSGALACFALLFLAYGLALYGGTGDHEAEAIALMLRLGLAIGVFWAAANLLRHERTATATLTALVVACAVRAALPFAGVASNVRLQGGGTARLSALGQNANAGAMVLLFGLLALLGLVYARRDRAGRIGWWVWLLGGLMVAAIVATGSRGALLALTAGLLPFLVAGGGTARQRLRRTAAGLGACVLVLVSTQRSEVMQERVAESVESGDLAGREQLYPLLLGMLGERPITGWGPIDNQFELAARLRDGEHLRRDAHNLYLEVVTAGGLPAALFLLCGLAFCGAAAWRARRGPRGVLPLAFVLAICVANVSANLISFELGWLLLGYVVASGTTAGAPGGAWRGPRHHPR